MGKYSPLPLDFVPKVGEGRQDAVPQRPSDRPPFIPEYGNSLPPDFWKSLPLDVQGRILEFLPLSDIFRAPLVCTEFLSVLQGGPFRQARPLFWPTESPLSPLVFYAKKDSWHLMGFDWEARRWMKLPPFQAPIPAPDPDLFKDFHVVAGDKGLISVAVGKSSEDEKLYVCNPLTGETHNLPPLKFVRHLVIMCLHTTLCSTTNGVTSSFRITAIGSDGSGLSRITEVYDSVRGTWKQASNEPEPGFSLESGVFCESENLLLCVGFMQNGSKGILAFDDEEIKWRTNWVCPFLQLHPDLLFHAAKLVECCDRIYLFSEQEASHRNVTLCIDNLKLESGGGYAWTREVTQTRRRQPHRMSFNNEYICVPLAENKLCIFNRFEPNQPGVVYDMLASDPSSSQTSHDILPLELLEKGIKFQTLLESQSCIFKPSFGVSTNQIDLDVVLADLPRSDLLELMPCLDLPDGSD